MSVSQNNEDARDRNQSRVQLPVTTNLSVNAGDLVYWDPTNFTVTPVTAASQVSTSNFLGMALQANASLIYPGDPDHAGVLVLVRGVVWMYTTVGDTYGWFTPVTGTADPQTITSTGATSHVVGYTLPPVASTPRPNQATPVPETIAGGTSVRVQVALAPSHVYAAAV
jgi:hypothetical protein